jgi:cell division protein FtsL
MVTQLAILLSACLALGLVFVFLWQSWQMVSLSAQLSRSLAELRAIQNEMEWLELRVSEAFSEAYVSRFAEERLGMIQVLPEILFLSPDSK